MWKGHHIVRPTRARTHQFQSVACPLRSLCPHARADTPLDARPIRARRKPLYRPLTRRIMLSLRLYRRRAVRLSLALYPRLRQHYGTGRPHLPLSRTRRIMSMPRRRHRRAARLSRRCCLGKTSWQRQQAALAFDHRPTHFVDAEVVYPGRCGRVLKPAPLPRREHLQPPY